MNGTCPGRLLTWVLAVAICTMCAQSASVDARVPAGATAIATAATATVYRTPDYVDVQLWVDVQEATALEAQERGRTKLATVLAAIEALALKDPQVETTHADIHPVYEAAPESAAQGLPWNATVKRAIVAYGGRSGVRVRTADLRAGGRIVEAALKAGATRLESVEFGLRDASAAKDEALALATADARRKADVVARALGLNVVAVLEATADAAPRAGGSPFSNLVASAQEPGVSMEDQTYVPGRIDVYVRVSLVCVASAPARAEPR